MHRDTVPLLCHLSTTISSCCSMIMHGPMLQGSVHNSWKLKTSLHHCVLWRLQRILPQDPLTHSESSWEDRWCLSPLPPGHLQHPSHPQSPLHCRWSHPPDTQLLQSAAIREETAESPGEDQQTEGQLHSSGCQEAQLYPPSPPLLSFTPRTLNSDTMTPPSLHPQDIPLPPPHLQTVTRTSHFAQHWTDPLPHPALTANYLFLTVWLKTVLWALITLTDW